MLKAKELRIGNLVQFISQELTSEITGVFLHSGSKKEWRVDTKYHGLNALDNYKPIPITEGWLLKFGFEKGKDNEYLFALGFGDVKKYFPIWSFKDGEFGYTEGRIQVRLKYVHQLQNLYFALTGEELTIKENV